MNSKVEYVPKRFNNTLLTNNINDKSILIAVLDTGVDPLSYGLITNPDGTKKIIDIIDCTGSDIVNTSIIKTFQELPQKIQDQINTSIDDNNKIFYGTRSLRTFISNRCFDNFDSNIQKNIENIIFFVYTYKFENIFYTIIDADIQIWKLREYDLFQECGSVDIGDNLSFSFGLHVYEDGAQTSLVFDTGSHATHVAGIIAGYFPDNLEQNGINPNARILSLKIGDSRVDGMETSEALCKALDYMVKYNCKLANYSFGESVCPVNSTLDGLNGQFIKKLNEYSLKHNIIFMTSAGNSGPAIMTVGAPRSCTENCISVGAYTDAEIMNNCYFASSNGFEKGVYQWSSRGPIFNRSMGVDVIAPGCALTSHPKWFKSNMNMCNGTSMACPNAVGMLSLYLQNSTTFNEKGLPFYWVKKFVENNCLKLNNCELIAQGRGLMFGNSTNSTDSTDLANSTDFLIKTKPYYYEINSAINKQYVGEFIQLDKNIEQHYQNILIKITPMKVNTNSDLNMHEFRKTLVVKSSFKSDELIIPNNVVVDSRSAMIRAQLQINSHKMNDIYSGYIEFYEEDDLNNFVGLYPINIIKYTTFTNNFYLNFELNPGMINRHYVLPKCNNLNIAIDTMRYTHNALFVEIAKITDVEKLDAKTRFYSRYFNTKEEMNENINIECIVDCLYEITVYNPWNSGINKSASHQLQLKFTYCNLNLHLNKYFADVGTNIKGVLSYDENFKKLKENNKINFNNKCLVRRVISKYSPYYSKIESESINGLQTKTLTTKYKIHQHTGKNIYYVNICNSIYNSDVTRSALLFGYKNNQIMFMGNYVPKSYEGQVDEIIIKISDDNIDVLKKYSEIILNVERSIQKSIEISTQYKNDINMMIDILLTKDTLTKNIKEIYKNDLIECEILGKTITYLNNSAELTNPVDLVELVDTVESAQLAKQSELVDLEKFLKDIDLLLQENEITKIAEKIIGKQQNLLMKDIAYYQMIMALYSQIHGTNFENIEIFSNTMKLNKLENNAPYCAYDYVSCVLLAEMTENAEKVEMAEMVEAEKQLTTEQNAQNIQNKPVFDVSHIDKLISSWEKIKINKNYWTSFNIVTFAKINLKIINKFTIDDKYKKFVITNKYICDSHYGY